MGSILTNIFGAAIGVLFAWWVGAIFIAASPASRMERACSPVVWTGNVATTLAMLFRLEEHSIASTRSAFEKGDYGCRFLVWRLFYEEDFKREQLAAERAKEEERAAAARQHPERPK
jgi:hypothetical protein